MKRLALVFAVAGLFAMSSCSKDYTCECSNGTSATFEGAKKGDAKDACDALQATQNILGSGVTCDLK